LGEGEVDDEEIFLEMRRNIGVFGGGNSVWKIFLFLCYGSVRRLIEVD
jgi:hypothetical protein